MAAAIERETGQRVDLVEGSGGVFTISVDGTALYDKRRSGRFPTEDDAVGIVRERAGNRGGKPQA